LRRKAKDYELCSPSTRLKDIDPPVLLPVTERATCMSAITATVARRAPITVAVWCEDSASSVLAKVLEARRAVEMVR
jgi:hypothetical protein